jgi:hypothetical protein
MDEGARASFSEMLMSNTRALIANAPMAITASQPQRGVFEHVYCFGYASTAPL